MHDFSNQVVIITGATGNLGQATARAFQAGGAKLVLVDRSADHLQQEFPNLLNSPDYKLASCTDLTHPDDIEAAIKGAIEQFGRLDVLVNAAGGFRAGTPLHETSLETWDFIT